MKANFFTRNNFVHPGDLCFDVGVRDGKITQELLAIGAEVVCVEAKHEHVIQMRETFGDSIIVVEAAVMDRVGEGQLYPYGTSSATMVPTIYEKQSSGKLLGEPQEVKTITLDELALIFGKPKFIKLDIEGSERYALKGMSFQPPALCFEFGGGYIEEAYKCVELLGDAYEFNYVRGHHGEWECYWMDAGGFIIDLPLRDERNKWLWGNVFARIRTN